MAGVLETQDEVSSELLLITASFLKYQLRKSVLCRMYLVRIKLLLYPKEHLQDTNIDY